MSQSKRRTVEQLRAAAALEAITEAKTLSKAGEYSSYARRAGALIQTQGLGQTLAFWRSKGWDKGKPKTNDAYAMLYQHMDNWLRKQVASKGADILNWITKEASTEEYRRATAEAQAYLIWLKRFAEAELGGNNNE